MGDPSRWLCVGLLVPALGLTACDQNMEDDDGLPGTSLGTYQVHAALQESTCGPGAFGAPDAWDFEVKLSRDDSVLYWNNGSELVEGKMADDGVAFSFSDQLTIPVTDKKGAQLGCVMLRQDTATGTLSADKPEDVTGFSGVLGYGYDQQVGSDCSELLQQAGATTVPCTIRYGLSATRTE
jgi:hypothetical protein